MLRIVFAFVVLFLFCMNTKAQVAEDRPDEIDSILSRLDHIRDTQKVNTLNLLSEHYLNFYLDPRHALVYSEQALALSKKISYQKGQIISLINIGASYIQLQDYILTKKYLEESLQLAKKSGYREGIVGSLNGFVSSYRDQSRYNEAFACSSEALRIADQLGNAALRATVLFESGRVLLQQATYPQAVEYFLEVIKTADSTRNGALKMLALTNLAMIYNALSEYDKALFYYLESFKIHSRFAKGPSVMHLVNIGETYFRKGNYTQSLNYTKQAYEEVIKGQNKYAIGVCLGNLAYSYSKLKEYDKALAHFNAAMAIHKSLSIDDGMIDISNGYGELYLGLKQYDKAIRYARQALAVIQKSEIKNRALDAYLILSQAYLGLRDYEKAYLYQSKRALLKDSLFSKENNQRIAVLNKNYELEKKQAQINLLAKTNELQQVRIKRQNLIKHILLIGLSLGFVFAALIFIAYRQKHFTNLELQQKNTEISLITEKLRQIQQNLNSALSSGLVGAWLGDLKKGLIYLDQSSSRLVGVSYNPNGYSYDDFERILHPDDKHRVQELRRDAIQKQKDYEAEYRILRPDGKMIWLFARGRADYDTKGIPVSFSGAIIDITDRKDAEQHKSDFLSIASHEIRTPITSVKLYIQIAERILNPDHPAYAPVRKAQTQLSRLERLSADLMDVSSITAGEMLYEYTEFDFGVVVKELVESMQFAVTTHKIILEKADSIRYRGDRYRIEQAINNLLSNAIKYSPDADHIIVNLGQENSHIILSVQDFGIGIPKESIGKINERFYRVKSDFNKYQGLGLGLYITSEILKHHKGKLWVESEPGKGSIFCFSLPIDHALNPGPAQFDEDKIGLAPDKPSIVSIK
jgi:PAS domain S-box-containing protein